MESQIIDKIEKSIFRITTKRSTPAEEKCGMLFKLLKPLNEGMYIDLLERYKKAIA